VSLPAPQPDWVHTGYAQRLVFGPGAVASLPGILKEMGARRVMLVTTAGRAASEEGEALAASLGRTRATTFDEVRSHVPTSVVRAAVGRARSEDIDAVVSFGGGSCADTAKAVCFFVEQERGMPGASYLDRAAVLHVSVPTTYSGAELTGHFGMTDEATRTKQGAGGPTVTPVAAVYDPWLTVSTPARVSAETGMNALAHGIECAYAPSRTPEAEAVALACISRLATHLPAVVDDPSDLAARSGALAGAALGGRCLQNAGMGVHHGLAQLVGGRTGISHGLANALLLGHALEFNLEAIGPAAQLIGTALGDPEDPAGAVHRLRERLGLPGGLSDAGVTEEDLEAVARLSQSHPAVRANVRPVSEEDARAVLDAAW
jgi:maleylacetate reductase